MKYYKYIMTLVLLSSSVAYACNYVHFTDSNGRRDYDHKSSSYCRDRAVRRISVI